MNASNRISLAALLISLFSLAASLSKDGARPTVAFSREYSVDAAHDEYDVRISNAGAGAMFDVTLIMLKSRP